MSDTGISIEYEREMLNVSTLGRHVPDPTWSHTDAHGHRHFFADEELPTLEWVVTGAYWCDQCRDEHEEGEWRCRVCGDVVEPRYNFTGPESERIPGLTHITLLIHGHRIPISEDDANRLRALEGPEQYAVAQEIAGIVAW